MIDSNQNQHYNENIDKIENQENNHGQECHVTNQAGSVAKQRIVEIGQKLELSLQADAELGVYERRRDRLRTDIFRGELELGQLKELSSNEQQDVEKLAHLTWSSLRLRITGALEEQVELEQLEAERAALKVKEAESTLELMRQQLSDNGEKMGELIPLIGQSNNLRLEQERLIVEAVPGIELQLREFDAEIKRQKQPKAEIQEAIAACFSLNENLDKAISKLESAANWGVGDMLGGGTISTGMKHKRLDEAQESLVKARSAAYRLEQELGDLGKNASFEIQLSNSTCLGDYWLDGLIMDLHVQSKIKDKLGKNMALRVETRALMHQLKVESARLEKGLEELRGQRQKLLINAIQ
ncbi:hypothetical protein [Paenibacillus herberti]|uniref:Toxic anion resistance protein n=1 Tax=Paenibacillus herberti TaxID=1619309 RepID=A0A229P1F6_9BACL|nr:hypothetical protein [Paenibacillus herberti]OXM16086.1 hypothetical protein CGZ75_05130 [Paenibacillus herberti]